MARPGLRLALTTLALLLATAPARAGETLTMAVAYFDNNTGQPSLEGLSRGLADMLLTDLSVAKELTLVERARLNAILDELKLGQSQAIDPKTAQKMGKLLGADLILTGSISAVEPTLRVDARIITVETGEILATAKADGPSAEFFTVEADLVKRLLDAIGVALTPIQKLQVGKPPTRSLPALKKYGEALEAADAQDPAAEKRALQGALQADPTFARAQQRLADLEQRLADLEKRTAVVESAGGLVINPTRPIDWWGNHKIHLERGEVATALADLQGMLKAAPKGLDGLLAYATHVMATAGKAPASADVRRFAPEVDAAEADLVAALVSKDTAAADALSAKLLAKRPEDPRAVWLRALALGPGVNPKPTADERAEELGHLDELGRGDVAKALDAQFVASESVKGAREGIAERLAYYGEAIPSWGLRRRLLVMPPVTTSFDGCCRLEVRIAEPSPRDVTLTLPDKTVLPLTFKPYRNAAGEAAIFEAKKDRDAVWPSGALRVTLRYVDGKGRKVETAFGAWFGTAAGLNDNNWRNLNYSIWAQRDRPAQQLVDAIGRIWTAPKATNHHALHMQPYWEGPPGAWGSPVWWRSPEVNRTGFERPIALRFTGKGGGWGVLGRAEWTWERRAGERQGQMKVPFESLSQEFGVGGTPWYPYPEGKLMVLLTVGELEQAVDLSLDLGFNGTAERGWRARLSGRNGDYYYAYLLAAAHRTRHREAEMRAGARWLPDNDDAPWIAELVAYVVGERSLGELVASAEERDRHLGDGDYPGRYRSEAATVVALASDRWGQEPAARDLVRAALPDTPLFSIEWQLLASQERARALADGVTAVKAGGRWFDRWEVTADEYLGCVAAGGCRRPSPATCGHARGDSDDDDWADHMGSYCFSFATNDYPMNWLTRDDAAAYCKWRGGELPSASEWKAAARGARWGPLADNLLDEESCVLSGASFDSPACKDEMDDALIAANRFDGYLGLAPRGVFPAGRTAEGLENLLGNVREWVRDGDNQAAGCDYHDAPGAVSGSPCNARVAPVATLGSGRVGLRCAYDDRPSRTAADQAAREKKRPAKGGRTPSVKWVSVPAGSFARGAERTWAELDVAGADKAAIAAVADEVDGLSAAELTGLLKELRKRKIGGALTAFQLNEFVARGRYRDRTVKQVFDLVFELIEPQEGEAAQKAANERAGEELQVSVYHSGAFSVWARKLKKDDEALTPDERREALWSYLLTYSGNDETMTRSLAPLVRIERLPRWSDSSAGGCLDQPPGRCIDVTGINGERLDDGGFVKKEEARVAGFKVMATEVTQAMYREATGQSPSPVSCDGCAVTQVSWDEADAFCKGVGGRLPTQDEWEYAARGGDAASRYADLSDLPWAWRTGGDGPPPVSKGKANGFGLRGMLGGVWEWVADDAERGRDYKKSIRGGSWASDPRLVTATQRVGYMRRMRSDFVGFRCAK